MVIQYTIVAIIIIGALVWMVRSVLKLRKQKGKCSGCSLADACRETRNGKNKMKHPDCH